MATIGCCCSEGAEVHNSGATVLFAPTFSCSVPPGALVEQVQGEHGNLLLSPRVPVTCDKMLWVFEDSGGVSPTPAPSLLGQPLGGKEPLPSSRGDRTRAGEDRTQALTQAEAKGSQLGPCLPCDTGRLLHTSIPSSAEGGSDAHITAGQRAVTQPRPVRCQAQVTVANVTTAVAKGQSTQDNWILMMSTRQALPRGSRAEAGARGPGVSSPRDTGGAWQATLQRGCPRLCQGGRLLIVAPHPEGPPSQAGAGVWWEDPGVGDTSVRSLLGDAPADAKSCFPLLGPLAPAGTGIRGHKRSIDIAPLISTPVSEGLAGK